MSSTNKHVSVPRTFSAGNFREWLVRFNICAQSNGWDDGVLHNKIATFLDGEALAVYLELTDAERQKFSDITSALQKNFHPESQQFDMLSAFNSREMLPDEPPRVFMHHLKNLLKNSGINEIAHEKLLFFRFISGLPSDISTQIKAIEGVKTCEQALNAAQRLISLRSSTAATASLVRGSDVDAEELRDLKTAVTSLTAKVDRLLDQEDERSVTAALQRDRRTDVRRGSRPVLICFRCQRAGHPARLCRAPLPAPPPAQRSGNGGGRGSTATSTLGRSHQRSMNFS